jgi:hypothetical protein
MSAAMAAFSTHFGTFKFRENFQVFRKPVTFSTKTLILNLHLLSQALKMIALLLHSNSHRDGRDRSVNGHSCLKK